LPAQRETGSQSAGPGSSRQDHARKFFFAQLESTTNKVLKLVVKADTQGSVEALSRRLRKIESEKVFLEIIHCAVGTITESDVALASASDAVILGFPTTRR
jgi:translation initiation factor IF-2